MKNIVKIYIYLQITILVGNGNLNAQVYPEDITHISSITQNMSAPHRMATDNNGAIYVSDVSKKEIIKYDISGNFVESINTGGSPLSIAINNANELFYGDSKTGIIYKSLSNGTFIEFYVGLKLPNSMVFDSGGLLYVTDSENKQVVVLSSNGELVSTIGDGTFIYPTGIAYDQTNNRILVAEHGGIGTGFKPVVKVWIFDLAGNLIQSFGKHGNADGQFYRIQGITVDACGLIYVVDPYLGRVSVFSSSGNFITKFGEYGTESGMLNIPMDVIINSERQAFITSMNSSSIEIYDLNKIYPESTINAGSIMLCPGSGFPIELTGTPPWNLTYTVDGLNPLSVNNITESSFYLDVNTAGIYAVTELSDAYCNGVNFSGEADISLYPLPNASISLNSATLCSVDFIDVELTGTSPWSIIYTIDGVDSIYKDNILTSPYSLPITQQGVYEVISVSDANCEVTGISEIATITVGSLPTATIKNTNPVLCQGGSTLIEIELTGTAPWSLTYEVDGANPVNVTNITSSPYLLAVNQVGQYSITAVSDAGNTGSCFVGTANVVGSPLPTSTITTSTATICPGESIGIELTGEAPWSLTYLVDGANPVTIDGIENSNYSLPAYQTGQYTISELSDAFCNGTIFLGNADITIRETPTASINNANICLGEITSLPVYLTGAAPWTLELAINENNKITTTNITESHYYIPVTQSGTYQTIKVTDAFCEGTGLSGSVVVNVKPTSEIVPVNEPVCEGKTVQLIFTGAAPWTFNYSIDGQIQSEITSNNQNYYLPVSVSGNYQIIRLNDNNCNGTDLGKNELIPVNTLPTSFIDSNPASVCFNQSIPVTLTGTAPWTFTYSINGLNAKSITTSESNYPLKVEENGVYDIIKLSDLNCIGTEFVGNKDITIKKLPTSTIANGNKKAELCDGESIDLVVEFTGEGPWEFTYTIEGLNPSTKISNDNSYIISATDLGAYDIISLTDANCTNYTETAYTDILINTKPDVYLGEDIAICQGQSQQLDAGGTYSSYFWNDGTTNQAINVASQGNYSVEVTNDLGCKDLDEIFVTVNPLPIVNLGEDITICEGTSTILDAGSSFSSYLWNNGSETQTIEVSQAGTFSITVSDDNLCENTDEIAVSTQPNPIAEFGYTNNDLEVVFVNNSLNAVSYLWSFGDNSTSTEINPVHTYSSSGNYDVSLTALSEVCGENIYSLSMSILKTFIEQINTKNGLKIFPNPSNGKFSVELRQKLKGNLLFEIFDFNGKLVYSGRNNNYQTKMDIDISHFKGGVYSLRISDKTSVLNGKIIILD